MLHSSIVPYRYNAFDCSLALFWVIQAEICLCLCQVTGETSISVFHWWENFCSCYLDHWCNNNEPCTLLVQSDVIGLVRNNSVSLFSRLENVEHSLGGMFLIYYLGP